MLSISIQKVFDEHFKDRDGHYAEDYILFRTIEDWCHDRLGTRWRFDYRVKLCVCGIDIPGRIIFVNKEDITAFKLRFKC